MAEVFAQGLCVALGSGWIGGGLEGGEQVDRSPQESLWPLMQGSPKVQACQKGSTCIMQVLVA